MAIDKTGDFEAKGESNFNEWIENAEGKIKSTGDITAKSFQRWPTADEMKGMIKTADGGDTMRTPIQFVDPAYFDPILFFIQHRDRKELNFRLRYYFEYHPYVSNIIELHSQFPLSDFNLQCADASIQHRYEDMADRIEMLTLLQDILKDFWLLGESFPYGRWSDAEKTWDYFSLIPPEKIELRSTYVTPNPIVILQVDDSLKKVVNSGDEVDKKIMEMMDPDVVERMKTQNYMPLPPWQVSHFARKTSRTDLRGTSVVKSILKDLLYEDKLRLLQFTFVDRHMFPLKIFKLGNPASVPSDHQVFIRNGDVSDDLTFDELWNKYPGEIIVYADGREVKIFPDDVDLQTLSLTDEGTWVWNKVVSVLRHPTPQDMYEVGAEATTISTANHGFLRMSPETCKLESVTPEQMLQRKSPAVVSCNKFPYATEAKWLWGKPITTDLAYFFGLWITDGNLPRQGTHLDICNSNEGIAAKVRTLATQLDCSLRERFREKDNCYYFSLGFDSDFKKILQQFLFGTTPDSHNKTTKARLPHELLFNIDDSVVGALLAGVIDGDGSIQFKEGDAKGVHIWSDSIKLLQQLNLSLLSRGITSRVKKHGTKGNHLVLSIRGGDNVTKLYSLISPFLSHTKKIESFKKFYDYHQSRKSDWQKNAFQNVYDLDTPTLKNLFAPGTSVRSNGLEDRSRVTAQTLREQATPSIEKDTLLKFYSTSVNSLKKVTPTTAYVYDLMLKDDPHYYVVGYKGWQVVRNTGWIPNRSHFEMLRQLLVSASNDPDFNIIFHHGLSIDYVGTKDKIENLIPHFEFTAKRILAGLFANQALVHGEGATYANANVSVRVLMHRYLTIRSRLELWANNKVFYPVAKARGYWKSDTTGSSGQVSTNVNGKYKILDLPKVRWQKLNLIDDTSQKNFLMRLYEKGALPHKMIAEIFDLSENDLRAQLKEEQGTVVDPVYIEARKAAAKDPDVQKAILEGKSTKQWPLKGSEPETKEDHPVSRETLPEEINVQPVIQEAPQVPIVPAAPVPLE